MEDPVLIGANIDLTIPRDERATGDVIAMQLSAITYCSLTHSVKSTLHECLPDWELVWEPREEVGGNYAFIAFNGAQYVIAIRGSILHFSKAAFENWFEEDFNILKQVPWSFPPDPADNPMVSLGCSNGLYNLTQLEDTNGDSILTFLIKNARPEGILLCVTGHSLGGNLATVFAPWLRYQLLEANQPLPSLFSVLTFAAPTSWNGAFADQYATNFTNTWRYCNVMDIVPFSACDVEGIGALYPPPAPAAKNIYADYKGKRISLSEFYLAIQVLITTSELYYNSVYAPVNQQRGTIHLNTSRQIYPVTATDPLEKWFEQAGAQHDSNHYLEWLGGDSIVCTKK